MYVHCYSGAGTNLKLGAHVGRKAPEKIFVVPLSFFGSTDTIGGVAQW